MLKILDMALLVNGCGRSGVWMCDGLFHDQGTEFRNWFTNPMSHLVGVRDMRHAMAYTITKGRIPSTWSFLFAKRRSRDVRSEQGFRKGGGRNVRG